jgi:hypothetical protein
MQPDVKANAMDAGVLELFWSLASLDAGTREAREGDRVQVASPNRQL